MVKIVVHIQLFKLVHEHHDACETDLACLPHADALKQCHGRIKSLWTLTNESVIVVDDQELRGKYF